LTKSPTVVAAVVDFGVVAAVDAAVVAFGVVAAVDAVAAFGVVQTPENVI
jgi:hypothetical protein